MGACSEGLREAVRHVSRTRLSHSASIAPISLRHRHLASTNIYMFAADMHGAINQSL